MTEGIPSAASEYLKAPGLLPVWEAIRRRLERNELTPKGILVVELSYQAAEDLSGLLKRTLPEGRVRLELSELDAALRASVVARGLVQVVAEVTGGPLVDRRAAGLAQRESRKGLWEQWEIELEHAGLQSAPWVGEWRDGVRRAGLLVRAGDAAPTTIGNAMAVLRALSAVVPLGARDVEMLRRAIPAAPTFELAELASRSCADAHALDDGRVTTALVLRAIAAATGEPMPVSAAGRRDLWGLVGVSPDTVSGSLLVWGVRPVGRTAWAEMMRARADLGLVTHLTLQEWPMARLSPWTTPGGRLFVCENPQVVQAAARAKAAGPLLCTSGNPATVATLALDKLVADGIDVTYHGDFDPMGARIAGRLIDRGARPWRYTDEDYREAIASIDSSSLPITGPVPDTPWSPGLAVAMRSHLIAVHEEALLDTLIGDLVIGHS